ncbi:MAG TPA: alpha/beta hydrolase [Micromonospora sp.]
MIGTSGAGPVVLHHSPVADARHRLTLLHGLGNSSGIWQPFLAGRPAETDIWLADLPWRAGHDPSWAHDDEPWSWVDRALSEVPGGAGVVVAHSFSAVLLLELLSRALVAGTDPARRYGLTGLVLVAPFYKRHPRQFDWAELSRYKDDYARLMAEGIRVVAGSRTSPELCALMADRVRDWLGPYGWLRFVDSYLRTPWLRTDLLAWPTLVVSGRDDFAALPAEGEVLAAELPRAELRVLDDCGHFLMAERPAAFSAVVDEFLLQLAASDAGTTTPHRHGRRSDEPHDRDRAEVAGREHDDGDGAAPLRGLQHRYLDRV